MSLPSSAPRLESLLLLAGSVISPALQAMPASNPKQPNIIYILTDDLGYGDLSCYGQQRFKTPAIDRMAGEGVRFLRHYAGSTVSAPSRASLMTGYHTGHSPIRGNREVQPEGQMPIPAAIPTVANLLQNAGYTTGCIGKWGLGFPGSEGDPNKKGFDYFFGYNCQREAHHYYPDHLWRNQERIEYPENRTSEKKGQFTHDLFAEEALQFITQNAQKPFFLYLTFTMPHADLDVPENSLAPFRGQFDEVPFKGGSYLKQDYPAAAFAGMMTRLDGDVGRILDLVRSLGIAENTLIIFTSDNGPHQEGGHRPAFFNSNGGLRGIKRDMYEGGIRVPFIAWWPETIEAGGVSDHVSAFWDFLPTACDLAGIATPKGKDGQSYLPELLGKKQPAHKYLYWEFNEGTEKRAFLENPYKLVRIGKPGTSGYRVELYDIEKDPSETVNLAASMPKKVAKMEEKMAKVRTHPEGSGAE